jgi:D-serine deaminase-like pyridoxal phosphate-dependent protein
MRLEELDTPAVVCDLDALDRNLASVPARCRELGIPFRAHTKSHKIPEIAHRQMASGAIGLCCQKIGEAEVMVAAGLTDILIPFNLVGPAKMERLTRLARRATMTVSVDSVEVAAGISRQATADGVCVRILLELDTGGRRCGVQTPAAARELARAVAGLPGLAFQGIMTYPSRLEARPFLEETLDLLRRDSIPVTTISGGGTGAEAVSVELGCTETRSGSYVWEGLSRVRGREDLNGERCPIRVVCTVVSTPAPGRVIIDGGMKTFLGFPRTPYGYCIEHPEVFFSGMSVEHGHLDTSASNHQFRVGERLSLIPHHQETTVNLHDEVVGVRQGRVELVWSVAGRGKVR